MRDLMAVVEFDDTEEPTELDGELIENVFGSVEDEPEHLEISLGGPARLRCYFWGNAWCRNGFHSRRESKR